MEDKDSVCVCVCVCVCVLYEKVTELVICVFCDDTFFFILNSSDLDSPHRKLNMSLNVTLNHPDL